MASIGYAPRGLGFQLDLAVDNVGLLTVRGAGLDDRNPKIEGPDELRGNVALLALVLEHAANELAYRRSRSPEKRKSHQKASESALKQAVALASLIEKLGEQQAAGGCSGCFERSDHRHVRGHDRPKRKYLCQNCGTATTRCAVPGCNHFAVVDPRALVTLRYCAEHRHAIPGYDKLDDQLESLNDVGEWMSYVAPNASRATKVAGGTLAAAAVVAPMAFFAAPAVGAALGGSALGGSLTGAAATSHGLAMLGGGAVASGGLGMAGGTAVVTATGTGLGGLLGGVTSSAYAGTDKSFRIVQLRRGTEQVVVLANGFLTQGRSDWADWQPMIDSRFPDATVYRVLWGAKELRDIGLLLTMSSVKQAVRRVLTTMARRGSKTLDGSLA